MKTAMIIIFTMIRKSIQTKVRRVFIICSKHFMVRVCWDYRCTVKARFLIFSFMLKMRLTFLFQKGMTLSSFFSVMFDERPVWMAEIEIDICFLLGETLDLWYMSYWFCLFYDIYFGCKHLYKLELCVQRYFIVINGQIHKKNGKYHFWYIFPLDKFPYRSFGILLKRQRVSKHWFYYL